MSVITVSTQDSKLKRKSSTILFTKDDIRYKSIPIKEIDAIVTLGNVQITTQTLFLLAEKGVPVTYLSMDGTLRGSFMPASTTNMDLRSKQYKLFEKESAVLEYAKAFLRYKILFSAKFIKEFARGYRNFAIDDFKDDIGNILYKVDTCEKYEKLLGLEGYYSRVYFSYYAYFFRGKFKFKIRKSFPPGDEINAMLSFGYVLLNQIIQGLSWGAGLDVYNGTLHKEKYGRASLALDILELFRSDTVDRFVVTLVNKSIITKADFTSLDGAFRLTDAGLKKYLTHWRELIYGKENNGVINIINKVVNELVKAIRNMVLPDFQKIYKPKDNKNDYCCL